MPTLNDPDQLSDSALDDGSANVYIDPVARTIKTVNGVGGLIAADGVIEKTIYSFLKEEWRNDPNSKGLAAIDFPMVPITDEFYELVDGWDWADTATRQSIRRGGWLVRNLAGAVTQHWAAIAILDAEADDQIYYDIGDGATNFTFTGNTAEAVQVISDPNGDGDYADGFNRSSNIVAYNREQGQIYSSNSTQSAGEASLLAPKLFSLGLPTGDDLKVTASDTDIQNNAPYTGMSIRFYPSPQSRTIGGVAYNFGVIVDGNNGTAEQIYEFVQYNLRQNSDIDTDAGPDIIGSLTDQLLQFVGDNLETLSVGNSDGGGSGVYIDNFQPADTNRISFTDSTGVSRSFPFVAAGNLEFNLNLQNDTDAVYRVFFTDGVDAGLEYGSTGAILVEDNSGVDLSGVVGGNASIGFDFDYDNNTQGNRTAGTDANITAIAIGLQTGQYVKTTATITRSNGNSINFVAAQERNYENP